MKQRHDLGFCVAARLIAIFAPIFAQPPYSAGRQMIT
jgi:hypothetical protein